MKPCHYPSGVENMMARYRDPKPATFYAANCLSRLCWGPRIANRTVLGDTITKATFLTLTMHVVHLGCYYKTEPPPPKKKIITV